MSFADLHLLKLFWGKIFAAIFLGLVLLFAKNAIWARGIKYNWFAVAASFLAIGFAIYVVFFVQP
ncbi:hypothetical protein [Bradyrhizobium sp. C9]|uniref:hypothetical protein n=1 Tax=Bradyrhizobium sp. C9 TaxID=142585 RepID=UPI000BE8FD39|nr:hypothetical protein [Bradyrhizobium sp. C9]PDT75889.1 hypothetical protein CO675_17325 [Bradyrhizobium sp. C9]